MGYRDSLTTLRKYKADYARNWRKANPEKAKEMDRNNRQKQSMERKKYAKKYYEDHKNEEEFKVRRNQRSIKHYYVHGDRAKARILVNKAVLRGKLVRPTICSNCVENKPVEGHHNDYLKPLDVIWLCKVCHENLHHQAIDQTIKNIEG